MNKFITKLAKIFLGLSMAAGVGIAVASNSEAVPAHADSSITGYDPVSSLSNGDVVYFTYVAGGTPQVLTSVTSGTKGDVTAISNKTMNTTYPLTVGKSGNNYTFKDKNNKYIAFTSTSTSSNNKLWLVDSATASGATWTVSFSGTTATIVNVYNNKRTLRGNTTSGQYRICGYTNATGNLLTLYKEASVTVTFNANGHGTAPSSQTITSGGKATQPTAPTATGWTFGGWYKEQACTNAWNFSTDTVSTNTTLWAKWTATTYSISYTLNGGTHGSTHPTSGTYDTAFSVSAPTKTGYTFTGWTVTSGLNISTAKWGTTSSPSTAISSSSTLCVNGTNAVYFKNINAASTAVTLTANWSINSYTVGGTISDGHLSSTANVDYNDPLSITIVPDQDFTYPSSIDSVTMGGVAYAGYTYDSTDGSFSIEHVTGNVVINAACVSTSAIERFFDYDLNNCSIENAPESMYDTEMKVLQIVADDHYKFPSSITVTGISAEKWEYDADEGTILINEPDGNIDIAVTCVAKAQNIISIGTLTGVTQKSGDPTTVEEGDIVTLTFIASSGYGLPTSSGITVTGVDSQSWSWDQNSGELEILGGTSNITVSVVATQRDLTNGSLTLGTKKTSYTTGDDFELPSTVTANFNLAPLTVNVKNDVVVSGPVTKNNDKYVVTGSGTVTLTYTFSTTGKTQSASYDIAANSITPSAGGIAKVTNVSDLTVGSTVYLVCEGRLNQLSGISTSGTKYGIGTSYTTTPANTYPLTVCAGYSSGTIAFKNSSNNYLYWTSGNSLNVDSTLSDNTSWTVTISSGNATILNAGDNSRQIMWNYSSPRFACYSGHTPTYDATEGYNMVQLYKNYPAVVKTLKWITAELKSGTYYKGTSVTASNFTVTAHYDDGTTSSVTSGISITNGTLNNLGENDVTLTYSGKSYVVKVTAVQAPVSSLTLDTNAATIGLDESYWLSDIGVTVSPSYAILDYTWSLEDDGGLTEGVDYTFDGDEYYSINPGTVVFRCTSDADANKYADFTLTISGTPGISVTESELNGFVGKGATLHFVYSNISDSDLGKIHFESSNTSVVDFADGIDAGEGTGIIEIEYLGAGNATISVNYNNGETLDTVTVSVENDSVKTVTWSASNIDVWSGATLSTTGWNVQYEMASGDHGAASSYVIKLVGQETSETITAGYEFKGTDNGKTIHVEYGGVSSSSITVTVTQRINNVYAPTWEENTWSHEIEAKTWSAAGSQTLNGKSWTQGGTGNGYWGYEDARGQQFGSGSNPYNPLTLSSSAFAGTISKVEVTTAGASSIVGTVSVSVGGTSFKCGNETSVSITTTSTKYTFTGTGSGTITISWNQTSSKAFYLKALSVTTLTQGQSVQIANSESHKSAQRVAVAYATAFNDAMDDTENCTTGLDDAWAKCQTAYNTFKTQAAALGSAEEEYAKNLVKYATRQYSDDSGEACLERMMKTYEVMVQKHGKSAYMSELVTLGAPQVSPLINMFNGQNTNTVAIIVIISMVSVTAIGGYFFLRKRKENI